MKNNITIITAVFNAAHIVENLCRSIENQSCDNFDWIVVDGRSVDNTLEVINNCTTRVTKIISESDFGIYDALNKGIQASLTEYYLVVGADDTLNAGALENFNYIIDSQKDSYDIITSDIIVEGKVKSLKKGPAWVHKQFAFVSSHAVGTVFKKELHKHFDYYSNAFPIAADQLFILRVCKAGCNVYKSNYISGIFGKGGVSSKDVLGTLTESYRIQMVFENKFIQTIIFILKLFKNFKRL